LRLYFFNPSTFERIIAAAPSQIPLAFPAVTVPFFKNTAGNFESCSRVVCERGCSSLSNNSS